jgi:hypothetical protein
MVQSQGLSTKLNHCRSRQFPAITTRMDRKLQKQEIVRTVLVVVVVLPKKGRLISKKKGAPPVAVAPPHLR